MNWASLWFVKSQFVTISNELTMNHKLAGSFWHESLNVPWIQFYIVLPLQCNGRGLQRHLNGFWFHFPITGPKHGDRSALRWHWYASPIRFHILKNPGPVNKNGKFIEVHGIWGSWYHGIWDNTNLHEPQFYPFMPLILFKWTEGIYFWMQGQG